jgi:hypothetical protein
MLGVDLLAKLFNLYCERCGTTWGTKISALHYSTVTLLAKFRGLSTSHPNSTAM